MHLLASALFLTAPGSAIAQVAPRPLPPTREEVTRPTTPSPILRGPKLEVEGGIERAPCALEGAEYQSIHFVLRGAEFDGLQGLTADQLASAYGPYVGRDVPISVVCEIRDRAGTILRNAGYIAAVQVPEQKITDGTVHFQVLMAHLTQVRVRGDASGAERIIAGYLDQLTKEQVFNRFDAERYLLLASDLPGYTVRLTLRPAGTTPGEVVGDVTVQHTPAYVDFNVENGGSQELGRWGGLVRGEIFGLTGLGDRTMLSVFSTADFHEQQTIQLAHDFRLGPQGLSIGDNFQLRLGQAVDSQLACPRPHAPEHLRGRLPDCPAAGADNPRVGWVGLRQPGCEARRNQAYARPPRSRFRPAGVRRAGHRFERSSRLREPRWRFANLLELRQGIRIFGATPDCGRLGANCWGQATCLPAGSRASRTRPYCVTPATVSFAPSRS